MKVAISTLHVRKNYNPSQEVYVAGLLCGLRDCAPRGLELHALVTPENRELFPLDGFRQIECPFIPSIGKRIAWEQKSLPGILRREEISIYHGTGNSALFRFPGKQVITVHYSPDYVAINAKAGAVRAYRKMMMGRSIRKADAVLCASEFLALSLRRIFGAGNAEPRKMHVVPMGVDRGYFSAAPRSEDSVILEKYGVTEPYLFAYADVLALKNESRIFKAWLRAQENVPPEVAVRLVLMGDPASEKTHEEDLRELGDMRRLVKFAGFVPREGLPALYRRAAAFIYPSLVESFGLCILEAMACGTPVLTSNITAMPEAAGGAALLVNPHDERAIEGGIRTLLSSPEERERLSAAGLARSEKMGWDNTARATADIYSTLARTV